MKRRIECRISETYAGHTLPAFLTTRFPYHDEMGWRERMAKGRILINDLPAAPQQTLAAGDRLEYLAADTTEPPVNRSLDIVFEDEDIWVINKPPNLPCHPAGRYFHHTLWAILKEQSGGIAPAFINRLDRETSGLVLVAKTPEAAEKGRRQFHGQRVEKRYLALVEGRFPDQLEGHGWLTSDTQSVLRKKRRFLATREGAPPEGSKTDWAETKFRCVGIHGEISAVEVVPLTGRLHQIRATLYGLGFPVVGDKVYGVDETIFLRFCTDALTDEDRRRLRMNRQALHAAALRFRHPRTGQELFFETPAPPDMAVLITPREITRP